MPRNSHVSPPFLGLFYWDVPASITLYPRTTAAPAILYLYRMCNSISPFSFQFTSRFSTLPTFRESIRNSIRGRHRPRPPPSDARPPVKKLLYPIILHFEPFTCSPHHRGTDLPGVGRTRAGGITEPVPEIQSGRQPPASHLSASFVSQRRQGRLHVMMYFMYVDVML